MSSDCKRRLWETNGSGETIQIRTAAGDGEEEVDRISHLPDEVVHEILALLRSPKEAAKASILSQRWFKLWRSYPILEFHDTQFESTQSVKRFVDAAKEKFSRRSGDTLISMKAVRIKFNGEKKWPVEICSALLDDMLELAANRSPPPQEINITAVFDINSDRVPNFDGSGTYSIPRGLLLPKPCHQFRLEALNLVNCNFDQFKDINIDVNNVHRNPFVSIGNPLSVLSLWEVRFPDGGDRILNSIIAGGASCLWCLHLFHIVGIRRLQVRNLPNLKFLLIAQFPVEDLEITGVPFMEDLHISNAPLGGDFLVSSMPNLKGLSIHRACKLTEQKFDELISNSPSLESLSLGGLNKVQNLKIFNHDKLWKVDLTSWDELQVIEMNAPELYHFRYCGKVDLFIKILVGASNYRKEVSMERCSGEVVYCKN
ncbi:unnamed protein product [Linum tenue]|uniref:At1g61320/AtMIF1 LRR domain-containing protein n=1 Tax=Linum tenue TaxID=586396 RepID=A0AAV0GZ71_9ROSI|nr:unnamed protein product [Linum tenue]